MANILRLESVDPEVLLKLRKAAYSAGAYKVVSLLNSALVTPDIKTMATSGSRLYINPEFVKMIGYEAAIGVLIHELLHNVFRHNDTPWARYNQNSGVSPKIWHDLANLAMDIVINDQVLLWKYKLPDQGAFRKDMQMDSSYNSSKKIFKYLLDKYITDAAARARIEEEIRKNLEQQKQRQVALDIKQLSGKAANSPRVTPQSASTVDKMTRDQLISLILQEQHLYGGRP